MLLLKTQCQTLVKWALERVLWSAGQNRTAPGRLLGPISAAFCRLGVCQQAGWAARAGDAATIRAVRAFAAMVKTTYTMIIFPLVQSCAPIPGVNNWVVFCLFVCCPNHLRWLVLYCFVTNYHQLHGLNTPFIILQFLLVTQHSWIPLCQVSQYWNK